MYSQGVAAVLTSFFIPTTLTHPLDRYSCSIMADTYTPDNFVNHRRRENWFLDHNQFIPVDLHGINAIDLATSKVHNHVRITFPMLSFWYLLNAYIMCVRHTCIKSDVFWGGSRLLCIPRIKWGNLSKARRKQELINLHTYVFEIIRMSGSGSSW